MIRQDSIGLLRLVERALGLGVGLQEVSNVAVAVIAVISCSPSLQCTQWIQRIQCDVHSVQSGWSRTWRCCPQVPRKCAAIYYRECHFQACPELSCSASLVSSLFNSWLLQNSRHSLSSNSRQRLKFTLIWKCCVRHARPKEFPDPSHCEWLLLVPYGKWRTSFLQLWRWETSTLRIVSTMACAVLELFVTRTSLPMFGCQSRAFLVG